MDSQHIHSYTHSPDLIVLKVHLKLVCHLQKTQILCDFRFSQPSRQHQLGDRLRERNPSRFFALEKGGLDGFRDLVKSFPSYFCSIPPYYQFTIPVAEPPLPPRKSEIQESRRLNYESVPDQQPIPRGKSAVTAWDGVVRNTRKADFQGVRKTSGPTVGDLHALDLKKYGFDFST